ncbi:MAG: hypothetical protein P8125_13135 [Gemmatimonadota bacterium]
MLEQGRRHHVDEQDGEDQGEVDLGLLLVGPPPVLLRVDAEARRQFRRFHDGITNQVAQLSGAPEFPGDGALVLLILSQDAGENVATVDGRYVGQPDILSAR